jgi:hypothetical protein
MIGSRLLVDGDELIVAAVSLRADDLDFVPQPR